MQALSLYLLYDSHEKNQKNWWAIYILNCKLMDKQTNKQMDKHSQIHGAIPSTWVSNNKNIEQ